ncbi:peptide ABC transporter permease [Acrocarpospora pleiomorpha]|uniref:Peptide ABC transporter permease n=1 Tax=Acrocarpospora pleiomorpha TaxID=90975 RepID=A0A5M3XSQ6_9ACTN|nr:ABC transporter permease [Acrocarpospora pleiomorpha]GES23856.1 peptide ABC transporter permease [Acrocarpospora pleiomorpha]
MSLTEASAEAEHIPEQAEAVRGKGPWQLAWERLTRDRAAMVSLGVIIVIVLLALLAPVFAAITGHGPQDAFPATGLTPEGLPVGPGSGFWLGADSLGRDLFIRILYGARISLLVGLLSTLLATLFGVVVGMVAGFYGGWVDGVLARVLDVVLSFPYLLVAIVLVAVLGASVPLMILVIAFFSFAAMARVVRGQTITYKEREFIEAARSMGASKPRTMFVDVVPNLIAPVTVLATLLIPTSIVFEATLSFLGLGVDPRTPSWGAILSDSVDYYRVAPGLLIFPAVMLLLTTLAFNLLGDGIRDALDPRGEGGR